MAPEDGRTHIPQGGLRPVCAPGEFCFAVVGLDHDHINGMCQGLLEAGGELVAVWDPDLAKVRAFRERFPTAVAASSEEEILSDPTVHMIASASVNSERASIGVRAMRAGKHFFVDKPPLTSLEQLDAVRLAIAETGRRYAVYWSEHIHVEAAIFAGQLVAAGAIGRVIHYLGMGPHRANVASRPAWFFDKARYGGILCDIGSHQIEQFLYYTGAEDARISHSRVANYAHPDYPGFEDFGDCCLVADNGATGYFRVDWFTPDGLSNWGDGRVLLVGTDGYIECRKYLNLATDPSGDHVYLVDSKGEHHFHVAGKVGFGFFGQLIRDCLDGTETAMSQAHILRAAELAVLAELNALRIA